jgi:hypothetical protein
MAFMAGCLLCVFLNEFIVFGAQLRSESGRFRLPGIAGFGLAQNCCGWITVQTDSEIDSGTRVERIAWGADRIVVVRSARSG